MVEQYREELVEKGYQVSLGKMMGEYRYSCPSLCSPRGGLALSLRLEMRLKLSGIGAVRKKLKWADQKTVRLALDREVREKYTVAAAIYCVASFLGLQASFFSSVAKVS